MKSFKALVFLTLAAALSCGANGSPTNITTDGYPTNPSPAVLKGIMAGLQDLADLYLKKYKHKSDYATFTKEYVNRLAWVRPYNYVVASVDSDPAFDGKRGEEWDQGTVYDYGSGDESGDALARFDVFVAGSGTFTRRGKGGYQNWAWNGFVEWNQNMKSNVVHFVKPRTGKQAEGSSD